MGLKQISTGSFAFLIGISMALGGPGYRDGGNYGMQTKEKKMSMKCDMWSSKDCKRMWKKASTEYNEKVYNVQKALNEKGYNIAQDGILGTETRNALHSFQLMHGLRPAEGMTTDTLEALGLAEPSGDFTEVAYLEPENATINYQAINVMPAPEPQADARVYKVYKETAIRRGMGMPSTALEDYKYPHGLNDD